MLELTHHCNCHQCMQQHVHKKQMCVDETMMEIRAVTTNTTARAAFATTCDCHRCRFGTGLWPIWWNNCWKVHTSEGSSHRQIATVTSYPINQNTRVKLILQHAIVIIRWTQAKTWGTEILEEEVEAESRKRIPKIQCLDNERDLFAMVVNILNFNWHCKSRAWELCYLCNSFDCSCSRSGEKDMNSMYGRIFNSA